MEPSNAATTTSFEEGHSRSEVLISLVNRLEEALKLMDEIGLSLAANHVSQGLELIRIQVKSNQNGDS